jgi:Protein of unknown function (DUF2927)
VKALLLSLLLALPASAQDAIPAGPLSDAALLRLLTCGAAPKGDCTVKPVRWRNPDLTISFGPIPRGYYDKRAARIERALDQAIATLNAAGSGVRLTRVSGRADIELRPTLFRMGEKIRTEDGVANGLRMSEGLFSIQPDASGRIRSATILIARDAKMPNIRSIVLEEITQSLGFRFDVRGGTYQDISIFAQWGNSVNEINGQDAAVLRLYYPEQP